MARSTAAKASADEAVVEERQLIGRLVTLGSGADARAELRQDDGACTLPRNTDLSERLAALSGEWVVIRAVCRVRRNDDREDDIVEVGEVRGLEPFDFTPLVVTAFEVGGVTRVLRTPLEVKPRPVDDLYAFDHPPLGIVAGGETRAEAEAEFVSELPWLWETYVEADEATLAADALRLRRALLAMVAKGAR